MVREFYGNFSADHQTRVFLRGKRIPFSEEDIRRHLGIDIKLPPPREDDMFKATVAAEKKGELDMDLVFQDVLLKWPTGNSRNLLPYLVFISRLAIRYQAPPASLEEQHPPSPPAQPAAYEIPTSSVQLSPEPSLREVMRYLHRQERLQLNTQSMLWDAFPNTQFRELLPVSSLENDSDTGS
ncbi:hypothetical protein PIB30_076748 [Stylosanthes scabra]|uniref:Uncharacterized protein n=1 Tax=Stylosanthes scabra TaxID=79078 RepID=A0ABU6TPW7_9FABA|nr:hypothetical protein [Stylosanthes scabra]